MTEALANTSSSSRVAHEHHEHSSSDRDKHPNSDTTTSEDYVKSIHIVNNGDAFNPPKRVVVNRRQIRTWESFLEELTLTLKPMHGAIRWVHTPNQGHRIHSLDEIRHEAQYVAVPFGEKLKLNESNQPPSSRRNDHGNRLEPLKPIESRRNKVESRILQGTYSQRKIIHVYRNGDEFCRPIHVLLKHFEQKDMEFVLRAVEERVILVTSKAIRRLYTMEGKRIKHPEDIEDGRSYVAAGVERFVDCNYGHRLPNLLLGAKRDRDKYDGVKFLSQRLTPPKEKRSRRTPLSLNDLSQSSSSDAHSRGKESKYEAGYKSAFQKSEYLTNERKSEKPRKDETENETAAATSIQAAYRGYAARKEMKENRPPSQSSKKPTPRRHEESPAPVNHIHDLSPREQEKRPVENASKIRRVVTPPPSSPVAEDEFVDDAETNRAAVKIQSNFRGHRTRKELREQNEAQTIEEQKQEPEHQPESEEKQTQPKQEQPHKHTPEQQEQKPAPGKEETQSQKAVATEAHHTEEEAAAVRIQATVRGYQTRKHLKETPAPQKKEESKEKQPSPVKKTQEVQEKHEKETDEEDDANLKAAATEIQAAYRGYSTRKQIQQHKQQEEAAVAIQSVYRGYQTRRGLHKQQQAAQEIQAAYQGYRTRRGITEQQAAATHIQAVYRGYRTRRELKGQQQAVEQLQAAPSSEATKEEDAVTLIQASYRGYRTRREYQRSKGVSMNDQGV